MTSQAFDAETAAARVLEAMLFARRCDTAQAASLQRAYVGTYRTSARP